MDEGLFCLSLRPDAPLRVSFPEGQRGNLNHMRHEQTSDPLPLRYSLVLIAIYLAQEISH